MPANKIANALSQIAYLEFFAALVLAVVMVGSHEGSGFLAVLVLISGLLSGVFMLGFAEIIKLLAEINGIR